MCLFKIKSTIWRNLYGHLRLYSSFTYHLLTISQDVWTLDLTFFPLFASLCSYLLCNFFFVVVLAFWPSLISITHFTRFHVKSVLYKPQIHTTSIPAYLFIFRIMSSSQLLNLSPYLKPDEGWPCAQHCKECDATRACRFSQWVWEPIITFLQKKHLKLRKVQLPPWPHN